MRKNTEFYTIKINANETWKEYCTRLAEEIRTIRCKIISCDIDPRDCITTIEYVN